MKKHISKFWNQLFSVEIRDRLLALIVLLGLGAIYFFVFYKHSLHGDFWFAGHDQDHFIVRSVYFHQNLLAGDWLPHWSVSMRAGYGYPFHLFYGSGAFYLAEIFKFFSLSDVNSWVAVTIFSYWVSAIGMYLFLRLYTGRAASLAGTIIYAFFPFHWSEVLVRTDPAQALAAYTCIIFSFYFGVRFLREKNIVHAVLGALCAMGCITTHTLSGLMWFPVLGLFLLWEAYHEKASAKIYYAVVAVGILTLALSAYYLIPAAIERALVHSERLFEGVYTDPVRHLGHELLSIKYIGDWMTTFHGYQMYALHPAPERELVAVLPLSLGVLIIFVAGLAKFFDKHLAPRAKSLLRFSVILFAITAFLGWSPWSAIFWDHMPLLYAFQFAWRIEPWFVFAAGAIAAVVSETLITARSSRIALLTSMFAIVWMASMPIMKDTTWMTKESTTRYDRTHYVVGDVKKMATPEHDTGYLGTVGEYMPKTVPIEFDRVPGDIYTPQNLPIADWSVIREEHAGHVTVYNHWVEGDTFKYEIDVSRAQKAHIDQFYFPGWQAYIKSHHVPADIKKINTYPTENGLIGFDLPIGQHMKLILKFENTPVRSWANTISLMAFIICLAMCFYARTVNAYLRHDDHGINFKKYQRRIKKFLLHPHIMKMSTAITKIKKYFHKLQTSAQKNHDNIWVWGTFIALFIVLWDLFYQGPSIWIIGHDGVHYLMRSILFQQALLGGDLVPRWSIDMVSGYGYPFAQFYGNGTFYLAELIIFVGHVIGNYLPYLILLAFSFALYKKYQSHPHTKKFNQFAEVVALASFIIGVGIIAIASQWQIEPVMKFREAFASFFDIYVVQSWNILNVITFWLSGLGMYFFMRFYTDRIPALAAALLFVFFPYHMGEVFMRSDIGESVAGFTTIIWALYFGVKYLREEKHKDLIISAFFLAFTILTHTLSGVIWFPFFVAFIFFEAYNLEKFKKLWLPLIYGGLLSIALAAFYWMPVGIEKSLVHTERLFVRTPEASILPHLFDLKYYLPSYELPPYYFQKLPPLTIGFLIFAIAALVQIFSKNTGSHDRKILIFWWCVFAFTAGVTGLSIASYFWIYFPGVYVLQFAWRLELVIGFCLCLFAAFAIQTLVQNKNFSRGLILATVVTIIWGTNFPFLKQVDSWRNNIPENWKEELPVGELERTTHYDVGNLHNLLKPEHSPGYHSTVDDEYQPYTVPTEFHRQISPKEGEMPESYNYLIPDEQKIADHSRLHGTSGYDPVVNYFENNGGANFIYEIENPVEQTVWMEHYYFPGWTARVNGKKVKTYTKEVIDPNAHEEHDQHILKEGHEGLITFDLPQGKYKLQVKLESSWPRLIGEITSLIAWIGALIYLIFGQKKVMGFLQKAVTKLSAPETPKRKPRRKTPTRRRITQTTTRKTTASKAAAKKTATKKTRSDADSSHRTTKSKTTKTSTKTTKPKTTAKKTTTRKPTTKKTTTRKKTNT